MKLIIGISGILAILQTILFWNKKPGVSVFIFTLACVLYLIYILKVNKKIINKKALILAIPIILLSGTYFIFNNIFFNMLNTLVIVILIIIMCVYLCKPKLKYPDFLKKFAYIIGGTLESTEEIINTLKIPEEKKNGKITNKLKKIGKALLITIPIILVVIFLLMSADKVFEGIFDKIFINLFKNISLDNVLMFAFRIVIAFVIFILFGGFFVNLVKQGTMFNKQSEETKISFKFDKLTINMILIILNIIYLIFSIIQITNLFMQTSNNPYFDYSSYARQGFFQLMFVSFINFIILIIANINKQEKTKKQKIYNKIMSLLIVVFTIIIIISAFYRMNLYQETFGYTYLRIFVDFVLITEGIISIPVIIKILGIKIDILKTTIIIISFMYVILNYMNVEKFIATKNIDRYFTNTETQNFDIDYLCDLGTDATPKMLELLTSKDEYIVKKVKKYLYQQKVVLNSEKTTWQESNISKNLAKEILNNLDI